MALGSTCNQSKHVNTGHRIPRAQTGSGAYQEGLRADDEPTPHACSQQHAVSVLDIVEAASAMRDVSTGRRVAKQHRNTPCQDQTSRRKIAPHTLSVQHITQEMRRQICQLTWWPHVSSEVQNQPLPVQLRRNLNRLVAVPPLSVQPRAKKTTNR